MYILLRLVVWVLLGFRLGCIFPTWARWLLLQHPHLQILVTTTVIVLSTMVAPAPPAKTRSGLSGGPVRYSTEYLRNIAGVAMSFRAFLNFPFFNI